MFRILFVSYSSVLIVVLLFTRSSALDPHRGHVFNLDGSDYAQTNQPSSVPGKYQTPSSDRESAIHIIDPPQYFQEYKANYKFSNPEQFTFNQSPSPKQHRKSEQKYHGSVLPVQKTDYDPINYATVKPNRVRDCDEFVVGDTLSVSDNQDIGAKNKPFGIPQINVPRVKERIVSKTTHTINIDRGYNHKTKENENRQHQTSRYSNKRTRRQTKASGQEVESYQTGQHRRNLAQINKTNQQNPSQDLLKHIANLILESKGLIGTKNCSAPDFGILARMPTKGNKSETILCKNIGQHTSMQCKTLKGPQNGLNVKELNQIPESAENEANNAAIYPSLLVYKDVMQTIASGKNKSQNVNQQDFISANLPIFDITKYFPQVLFWESSPQKSNVEISGEPNNQIHGTLTTDSIQATATINQRSREIYDNPRKYSERLHDNVAQRDIVPQHHVPALQHRIHPKQVIRNPQNRYH